MLPALALVSLLLLSPVQAPQCMDSSSCREEALGAAARGDYERFHDLAWRAVQRGRPNDPELMIVLARAQSLSGRPGDALVMLRRLALMGVATAAREHEDFARVRGLADWPAVEALLAAAAEGRKPPPDAPAESVPPPPRPPARSPAAAAPAGTAPAPARAATVAAPAGGEEALRLSTLQIDGVAMAYDSASQRFVLGDRRANKLIVADDVFKHVNDLAGPVSAGFGALTSLAIDGRRGDLWVTSNGRDGSASIHKLQLVSGRTVSRVEVPADLLPALFSDIAVTDRGMLVLVDSAGSRLMRMTGTGGALEPVIHIGQAALSSVAAAGEAAYVAHATGLTRADLQTGRLTEVRAGPQVALSGLRRIRWYRNSLIAIQHGQPDSRIVRIRLARGGTVASAVEPLDDYPASSGAALTISRDAAYYLAETEGDPVIRRVPLR